MRTRLVMLTAALIFPIACSPGGPNGAAGNGANGDPANVDPPPTQTAAPGFPANWKTFDQLNEVTRSESSEIRELYANEKAADAPYAPGSVLVKAHYRIDGGSKGALTRISVMTKTRGADNNGWQFDVYGPTGSRMDADVDVCVMCHTQRRDHDYVFSER